MTQIEQILFELDKVDSRGLMSGDIQEKTGIPAGTIRTTLYELGKREWIRKSGSRGSYRYVITSKGRTELYTRQPLANQREAVAPVNKDTQKAMADYEHVLQLMNRSEEFATLRRFVASLYYESGIDFSGSEEVSKGMLDAWVLQYMGVDPHEVDSTLAKLDEISTAIRNTM